MSAPDFDDGGEGIGFLGEDGVERLEGREEGFGEGYCGGDMHHGWEGVVRGGGHVNVIVGVNRTFAAHGATEDLYGPVGDDFVGVHV